MPMVGITIALLWVQRRLLARKSYVTVGGKGGHREPMALGGFRWVLFGYAMAIAALSVFMPLYIILQTRVQQGLGAADVGQEFYAQ